MFSLYHLYPFLLAQWVKNEHAKTFQVQCPRAVEAIVNRHYVDDFLDSFETEEEAIRVSKDIEYIQKSAGFEIHDWVSNSTNVARQLSGTNEHDMEQELTKNLSSNKENEKVLGLYWDTEKDVLKFDVELLKGSRAPTKRELLRTMMSVFDPMGMLSHYMFHIKAVFQDACRLKLNWDQVLEQRYWNAGKFGLMCCQRLVKSQFPEIIPLNS